MLYMNEYDINEARGRHAKHPILGPATQTLANLMDAADACSDGWAYWPMPARAARKLMELIQGPRVGGPEIPTAADLKAAYAPLKAFRTKDAARVAARPGERGCVFEIVEVGASQPTKRPAAAVVHTPPGLKPGDRTPVLFRGTLAECEAWVYERSKTDPGGVYQGHYGIDAGEVEEPTNEPTKRPAAAAPTGTTRYKVWLEVEEIRNEGTADETYQTLDLPFGSTASFDTLEEAEAFAERVHRAFEEEGA